MSGYSVLAPVMIQGKEKKQTKTQWGRYTYLNRGNVDGSELLTNRGRDVDWDIQLLYLVTVHYPISLGLHRQHLLPLPVVCCNCQATECRRGSSWWPQHHLCYLSSIYADQVIWLGLNTGFNDEWTIICCCGWVTQKGRGHIGLNLDQLWTITLLQDHGHGAWNLKQFGISVACLELFQKKNSNSMLIFHVKGTLRITF